MGVTQLPLYLKSRMKGRVVSWSSLLGAILRKQKRYWECLLLLYLHGNAGGGRSSKSAHRVMAYFTEISL